MCLQIHTLKYCQLELSYLLINFLRKEISAVEEEMESFPQVMMLQLLENLSRFLTWKIYFYHILKSVTKGATNHDGTVLEFEYLGVE